MPSCGRVKLPWWRRRGVGYPTAIVIACLLLNVTGFTDGLFFVPDRVDYGSPRAWGLAFEPVSFPGRDGTRLTGWFLPAKGPAKGTVVHAHGNAGNKSMHVQGIAFLPPAGFNVLELDYRGYGESEGRPSRRGCVEDVHAALDYVLGRPDVDRTRVALFGQSLGASIVIVTGAERPDVRAVAAEASFTSHRAIGRDVLQRNPVTWLLAWPMSWLALGGSCAPIDAVDHIAPRPLFLAHGTADTLIPFRMGEELYARAKPPKRFWRIEGGMHLHAPDEQALREYHVALVRFLEESLRAPDGTKKP